MVWYGMVWYGMVWYGMVWYGMVWYGMVWYGIVFFCRVELTSRRKTGVPFILIFQTPNTKYPKALLIDFASLQMFVKWRQNVPKLAGKLLSLIAKSSQNLI